MKTRILHVRQDLAIVGYNYNPDSPDPTWKFRKRNILCMSLMFKLEDYDKIARRLAKLRILTLSSQKLRPNCPDITTVQIQKLTTQGQTFCTDLAVCEK